MGGRSHGQSGAGRMRVHTPDWCCPMPNLRSLATRTAAVSMLAYSPARHGCSLPQRHQQATDHEPCTRTMHGGGGYRPLSSDRQRTDSKRNTASMNSASVFAKSSYLRRAQPSGAASRAVNVKWRCIAPLRGDPFGDGVGVSDKGVMKQREKRRHLSVCPVRERHTRLVHHVVPTHLPLAKRSRSKVSFIPQ